MFRSETARERSLLRQVEAMQRTINDQNDRIMFLAGHAWSMPETVGEPDPDESMLQGALAGLPPGWPSDDDEG